MNTVGLYSSFQCQESVTQSILFHSYTAVGIELLSTREADSFMGGLVTKSYLTLETPWTVACQAPLSMGFSRQEYESGLPFPSQGDLPNPGIEPRSPTPKMDSLLSEPPGNHDV